MRGFQEVELTFKDLSPNQIEVPIFLFLKANPIILSSSDLNGFKAEVETLLTQFLRIQPVLEFNSEIVRT